MHLARIASAASDLEQRSMITIQKDRKLRTMFLFGLCPLSVAFTQELHSTLAHDICLQPWRCLTYRMLCGSACSQTFHGRNVGGRDRSKPTTFREPRHEGGRIMSARWCMP